MPTTTAPKKKTAKGRFGPYGGRYVPETLMAALQELEAAYAEARRDKSFKQEYLHLLHTYAGRPTPLFFAERLTKALQGGHEGFGNVASAVGAEAAFGLLGRGECRHD